VLGHPFSSTGSYFFFGEVQSFYDGEKKMFKTLLLKFVPLPKTGPEIRTIKHFFPAVIYDLAAII